MDAWINYIGKLVFSMLPIVLMLAPFLIWQMRRIKKTIRSHDEALELQRRSLALQEEQVRDQKTLIEILKKFDK